MYARAAMSLLAGVGGALGLYLVSVIVGGVFGFFLVVLRSIGLLIVGLMWVVIIALFWFVAGHVLYIESKRRRALMVAGMAGPWFAVTAANLYWMSPGRVMDIELNPAPTVLIIAAAAISTLGFVIFGIACGIKYWQSHSPAVEGPVTWRITAATDTVREDDADSQRRAC